MGLTTNTISLRSGSVAEVSAARVPLTRADVMSAREVAALLGLPASTVYELARRGVLPGCKLGRTWRFLRPAIEAALQAD